MVINGFGGPEVLVPAELPLPEPGADEVRIRVQAVAVARTKDVAARAGRPPFGPMITAFPHVLGTEHAGVVDAVGSAVGDLSPGTRVAVSAVLSCGKCRGCVIGHEEACETFGLIGVHRQGSYAEYVVAPAGNVHRLPDDVDAASAAAVAANGPVARAQLDAGLVGEGSTVLVIGAGGALGSMAATLAAWRGARVIGVDRLADRPDRLDGLPLAASVDGDGEQLPQLIASAAGSWGLDCVIDNLGLPAVWAAYRPAVAYLGRIIVSGAISHDALPMQLLPFYLRSQSLIGVRTGNRAQMAAVWRDVHEGFRPPRDHVRRVPFADVSNAHAQVEAGTTHGQTVLEML
ncbi:alcohol dehydrogenase catalytic domain-containing protein [uncultured Jatrophihabitans sp.]|uniref:alcohol dehydrogenase catalytic domain-containing protein n=1 Tax=uncultured Jatrophihabitans sp. TaxID=1610747 RepID=UPI0035CBB305